MFYHYLASLLASGQTDLKQTMQHVFRVRETKSRALPDVALKGAWDESSDAVAGQVELNEDDEALKSGCIHVRDGAVAQVHLRMRIKYLNLKLHQDHSYASDVELTFCKLIIPALRKARSDSEPNGLPLM